MSIKFAFQKFKYKSLSVYEAPTVKLTNMFFRGAFIIYFYSICLIAYTTMKKQILTIRINALQLHKNRLFIIYLHVYVLFSIDSCFL